MTNSDEDDEDDLETSKNSSDLNCTEIIATLALELRHVGRQIQNSATKRPFQLKIGQTESGVSMSDDPLGFFGYFRIS